MPLKDTFLKTHFGHLQQTVIYGVPVIAVGRCCERRSFQQVAGESSQEVFPRPKLSPVLLVQALKHCASYLRLALLAPWEIQTFQRQWMREVPLLPVLNFKSGLSQPSNWDGLDTGNLTCGSFFTLLLFGFYGNLNLWGSSVYRGYKQVFVSSDVSKMGSSRRL